MSPHEKEKRIEIENDENRNKNNKKEVANIPRLYEEYKKCSTLPELRQISVENWKKIPRNSEDTCFKRVSSMSVPLGLALLR